MVSSRVPIALGAMVIALSSAAWASDPNAAEKETARRLMDQGKAALARQDYEQAIAAYGKADALVHVPTTAMALAKAQLAAGRLVEARDAALEAARMPVKENEAPAQDVARAAGRELEAQLKARIPSVQVKLVNPQDAALALDGRKLALALIETPLAVNPGHHVLTATLPSGTTRASEFDAAEGRSANVTIELPVEAAPTVTPPPAQPTSVEPTAHDTTAPPPPSSSAAKMLVGTGVGLAVVGIGVGAVFGAMTLGSASTVKASCTGDRCSPSVSSDLSNARTFAVVSDVGFIAAGIGAVLAVTGLVLWPKSARANVGLGPGGVFVSGWL